MSDYIDRHALLDALIRFGDELDAGKLREVISYFPAAEVVPWEKLRRYADYFCAYVSYPEFIREAKMFYDSTKAAMDGGNIT